MFPNVISALGIADEQFLIASLIERCPRTMMIRELLMNALEASQKAAADNRVVEISIRIESETPKLAIWNSGPGMDARELLQASDIACSIGKEKSLTGNFGMGAKVASLPANQYGLRYRSCKNGKVHEVILCKREGIYGRLKRRDDNTGEYHEVIDVTNSAINIGRELSFDWTEVLLLGNSPAQNTVKDPYGNGLKQDGQWLANYLYHRFYRLPTGVRVILLRGTHKLDGNRQFQPISGRNNIFERSETILTDTGIKIHYIYDAPYDKKTGAGHNKSLSGAVASDVSTCAVIYKNEMYDLRRGRSWLYDAPIFGITYGARHISIHIEVPDTAEIVPDGYRQFLRYAFGEQNHVVATDFAEIVRDNRPLWLQELIKNLSPEGTSNDDIRDELQKLLNTLRVKRKSLQPKSLGQERAGPSIHPGADTEAGASTRHNGEEKLDHPKPTDLSIMPSGAKRASLAENLERAPEIIKLCSESEIEEKGLKGRAGRYISETSQLFINMKYTAIQDMQSHLETRYPGAVDIEALRELSKQHSEKSMILRVGRNVVFALAKKLNKEWDEKALDIALSPESLSMAADNFLDGIQNAGRAIGKALRITKTAA